LARIQIGEKPPKPTLPQNLVKPPGSPFLLISLQTRQIYADEHDEEGDFGTHLAIESVNRHAEILKFGDA